VVGGIVGLGDLYELAKWVEGLFGDRPRPPSLACSGLIVASGIDVGKGLAFIQVATDATAVEGAAEGAAAVGASGAFADFMTTAGEYGSIITTYLDMQVPELFQFGAGVNLLHDIAAGKAPSDAWTAVGQAEQENADEAERFFLPDVKGTLGDLSNTSQTCRRIF
jgi:hypothetical protein